MVLSNKRITKALIRLRGCAGWSATVLFANPRRQVFSRRGPHVTNQSNAHLAIFSRSEFRNYAAEIGFFSTIIKILVSSIKIIFHVVFLSSADFLSKSTFSKSSFRNTTRVSYSLNPDPDLSGLIWFQSVCKSYQQTTLGDKELYILVKELNILAVYL